MPPRKAASTVAPAVAVADEEEQEAPRRSGRVAANAALSAASKPATKAKAPTTTKKRPVKAVDEGDETEEKAVKPPKKAKAAAEPKVKSTEPAEAEPEEKAGELLDLGDSLSQLDITLKNEEGEDVVVKDLVGSDNGVVLFLVPKADTPGCTTQACSFRDNYSEFKELGYEVYCVSTDTSAAQLKWKTKKSLSYSLLSDPQRQLIKALGAFKAPKSTNRSHFVFEKGTGKLIEKRGTVKAADSSSLALKFIQEHHAE